MSGQDGDEPEIALVLSPDGWVESLHRHCADHGGARVRCIVVEPAVAIDEDYGVLVVTDRWPALTRPFVDILHARGRRVLVVHDDGDPIAGDFVARLGADGAISSAATPADIVAMAAVLAPASVEVAASDSELRAAERSRRGGDGARRAVVAVGGPSGAGSTEIAIGLAGESVRRGAQSVIVDADDVTPSVAVRLGLPMEPNLCTAVDAVAYGLGAVPGALFDLGPEWPAVLVGAPSRAAGAALRADDVVAVAEVLAVRYSPVIVDIAAGINAGANGAPLSRAIVAHAAAVVAVGLATPIGILRLLDWLMDVDARGANGAVHVVVNRAPDARSRRAQLAAELLRDGRVRGLTFVPTDPRVEDAVWEATITTRGPFARCVGDVLDSLGDRIRPAPEESRRG